MTNTIKNFFRITENTYKFETMDISSLLTVLNVALVLMGFWWAPIIGIANCVFGLACNIKNRSHINGYVMQIALIVLNVYFLTL